MNLIEENWFSLFLNPESVNFKSNVISKVEWKNNGVGVTIPRETIRKKQERKKTILKSN